jgi:ceramide glucosyltransferase
MLWTILRWTAAGGATLCYFYYLFAVVGARRFFSRRYNAHPDFTPPVSILKPVRGLDREAYENFASFCRQDYPEYEILFGVSNADDPAVPVIQKLIADFPQCRIRLLIGSSGRGSNNKVAKLCRLAREARYDILAVSDSDVRASSEYLRTIVAPLHDAEVGAVTCVYRPIAAPQTGSELEAVQVVSDFFARVAAAWQLEGVRFALGGTMVTTRRRLEEIGGFEAIADCFFDDFELGSRIAAKGHRVVLLPDAIAILFPFQTVAEFFRRQWRWAIGLRHSRPWSHLGLIIVHGLLWSLAAIAAWHSTMATALFAVCYALLRGILAWTVGVWGLRDDLVKRKLWLVPLADAIDFAAWVASFTSNRIEWRGAAFSVEKGRLIPLPAAPAASLAGEESQLKNPALRPLGDSTNSDPRGRIG